MTSSKRAGMAQDYGIQAYKPYDAMCEPGLISILFLSCGKHNLASVSLASTAAAARHHRGELEWCFLEQGSGEDAERNLRMFQDFQAERKVIIQPDTNYGINSGFNTLWAVSRGEFCMHHENDWVNKSPDFPMFQTALDIFAQHTDIGIVQLRAVYDPHENWGFRKKDYNPWSCDFVEAKVCVEKTDQGHEYLVCEFDNGWNHNPQIVRKSVFREAGPLEEPPMTADPRHGETTMQARVADTQCTIAHVGPELYFHAGGVARKDYGC